MSPSVQILSESELGLYYEGQIREKGVWQEKSVLKPGKQFLYPAFHLTGMMGRK